MEGRNNLNFKGFYANKRLLTIILIIVFTVNALFLPLSFDVFNQLPKANDVILANTQHGSFVLVNDAKNPAFKHLTSKLFFSYHLLTCFCNISQSFYQKKNLFNFRKKMKRFLSNCFHGSKYKHINSLI
jgi:hypothetical protein